jgi:hypothetical protein
MKTSHGRAIIARDATVGIALFILTSLISFLGVTFGRERLTNTHDPEPLLQSFGHYDSLHYRSICERGYSYHPALKSEVAFFPAYPFLARLVRFVFGCPAEWALLVVSYLCLAGCFVVLHAYARQRRPDGPAVFPSYAVVAFGLFPTTCFFRFAYTNRSFFSSP